MFAGVFIMWRAPLPKLIFRPLLACLSLAISLFSGVALADFSPLKQTSTGWLTDNNHPPVSVLAALTGKVDKVSQSLNALLQVKLSGDWKTYWRSPGEGGVAPTFDITNSSNIKEVHWLWPAPKRYPVSGVETLGYKGLINFPRVIQL